MMPRFRFDHPWRVLWQITTSDYVLGTVLLALALALLLAAWLPQTSADGAASDVEWQAQVQRRFGGAAWFDTIRSPLQSTGAFHVADAVGFRLLLALLAFVLLVRLVDCVERFWQGWRGGAPAEGVSWAAVETSFDELVTGLRGRRLRIAVEGKGNARQESGKKLARADRWPWGELGPVWVYAGGLLILLGVALTARGGWQTELLSLAAGESAPLGHESGLTLRLETLTQDGRHGSGEIWRGEDTLVGAGDLSVGRPLRGDGVGAYLVGSGTGLRVRATLISSDTQVLRLATGPDDKGQKELILALTKDEPRHMVGVPDAGLFLLLSASNPGQIDAQAQVQVFEWGSGQLIAEKNLSADTVLRVKDVSFDLLPVPYAEIRTVRDPGAFWVQLGVVGLIAGAILWGLWSPRRLWLRREASSDAVAASGDLSLLPMSAKPADGGNG